jgi:hypothetical protein
MIALLSLVLAADTLTYRNESITADDVQLADDFIHEKLHLLYTDITTNNVRIVPERAQVADGDDGQYVRVYQRIQRYETIVTVFISKAYKLRLVSIVPETATSVAGGYNFHDPATLDEDILNDILDLLKSSNRFSGKVASVVEYRTHVQRGLTVHVVFYDEEGVLHSVEYVIDVGTNPNSITSYLTDQASTATSPAAPTRPTGPATRAAPLRRAK